MAGRAGDKVSDRGALAITDGEGCCRCAELSRLLGATPVEGDISGIGELDGCEAIVGGG